MIRFGILGCGDAARRLVGPAIGRVAGMKVQAIASRELTKAMPLADAFSAIAVEGYQALLERDDVDAVYVALPIGLHHEWALKALKAGKHVLVEKSAGQSAAEVREMIVCAKKHERIIFENFMFLYHLQTHRLQQELQGGKIGELRCMRASFGFPPHQGTSFRYSHALGGGALLDAGTYTLRAAALFLGCDVRVMAGNLHVDPQRGVDIYGGAMLSNTAGVSAQVAFGFDNYYQNCIELWGSKGKIVSTRAFTAGLGFQPTLIFEEQNRCEGIVLPSDDHFANLLLAFGEAICAGSQDHGAAMIKQAECLDQVRVLALGNQYT